MPPKQRDIELKVNRFNPYGVIVNPEKKFVPREERKNQDIGKFPFPKKLTLDKLLGWDQESANFLKASQKLEPNHKKNRAINKRARASRKRNRPA